MSIEEKDEEVLVASAGFGSSSADIEFSDVESEVSRNLVVIDGVTGQRD